MENPPSGFARTTLADMASAFENSAKMAEIIHIAVEKEKQ